MRAWLLLLVMAVVIKGEWSDDPGNPVNLGSGIQPQIIGTSDDGTYVAWLSDGNYHIYLQRLDVNGNPQWTNGGLLVSDATNSSWIAVYHLNLAVDGEDNAIITSVDTRTGNWEVYAYKIDPSGNQLWGENGLALSSSGNDNISPRLTVEPSDNSVIVTWSDNFTSLRLQRISADGEVLWGAHGLLVSTFNANLVSPQPRLSSDGHILVQAIRQTGSFPALSSQIVLQKFNLDGTALWATWTPIASPVAFPLGNWLQDLAPDNSGGVFTSWTQMTTNNQTGKVQRVNSNGDESWTSPLELSDRSTHFRVSPRITALVESPDIYAVWGESDASQVNRGIFAQKVDSSGIRQWGNGGLGIEALSGQNFFDLNVSTWNDDLLAVYIRQSVSGSKELVATRIQADLIYTWSAGEVILTSSGADKKDLSIAQSTNHAVLAWSEAGTIKAHCLLEDGSLGIPVEPPDIFNYFPMTVGQRWSYASVLDSTFISVVDSFLMNDEPYYVFDEWYPNETINNFRKDGFDVLVNAGAADQLLYDFGADLNDTWNFNFPGSDISEVTLTSRGDTLETMYGIFTNCVGFHRFIGADYEYYDWFAPHVGLVQRDVVTFAGPMRYQLYNIEQVVVGLDQEKLNIPEAVILKQNFPNPFNPGTHIQYELPEGVEISVLIYDVNGAQVSVLHKGFQEAGNHKLEWLGVYENGISVPAGLYFCRASGAGFAKTIKMVFLK